MKKTFLILPLLFALFSCEQEIDLDFPEHEPQYVVEGYIDINTPPIILISKSSSYFSTISTDVIFENIVQGADIKVSDGQDEYDLIEISSTNLGENIQTIEDSLGIEFDFTLLDELAGLPAGTIEFLIENGDGDNPFIDNPIPPFSIYTSLELLGEENKTYSLNINTPDNTKLTAETYLPFATPVDSLWLVPHPNPENDTLVTLVVRFTDNASTNNQIRYFTQRNQELPSPPPFASVLDDRSFFNLSGESFNFPLERGQSLQDSSFDFQTYSYFHVDDTITLRWAAIDVPHFEFWSTLEFDRSQAGNPFGRPTIIRSNINGGLGIWGAYSSSFHQIEPYSQTNDE
ncbi:MAG: DUF4249 domain-containing protein [Cytophagales bacterium]|nr:DUF4249 domain-containing protein [Cytophagales bacterium]